MMEFCELCEIESKWPQRAMNGQYRRICEDHPGQGEVGRIAAGEAHGDDIRSGFSVQLTYFSRAGQERQGIVVENLVGLNRAGVIKTMSAMSSKCMSRWDFEFGEIGHTAFRISVFTT
jgi:hypothetical protein